MGAITLISVSFLGIRNKINVEIISIIKNEKIKICFFFIISTFNLLTSYTLYEGLNKNINKKGGCIKINLIQSDKKKEENS